MGSASVLRGFRFLPTDEELIAVYLASKLAGDIIPQNPIIDQGDNVYLLRPENFPSMTSDVQRGKHMAFFFTCMPLHPGTELSTEMGSSRGQTYCGTGYWRVMGLRTNVRVNNKTLGFKQALAFYNGQFPLGVKTDWKIDEYRLNTDSDDPFTNRNSWLGTNYVICKVYRISALTPRSLSNLE